MASSKFTVSAADFSDVQYKCDSVLAVDEDSKQKNGCK